MLEEAVRLERTAHEVEQDGDDMKAIRLMERAVGLRVDGSPDATETAKAAERLAVKYNTVAVRCFKNDDFETATALLSNAQRLTEPTSAALRNAPQLCQKLRGTTFNNMGCMERRRGRLELAIKYLELSLEHDGSQSPVTYLNLSALFTQVTRIDEAVAAARRAIGLLSSHPSENPGLIAVAYHNLAMALEHGDPDACAAAYEQALKLSRSQLGATSPTTVSIQRNYDRFSARAGRTKARQPSEVIAPNHAFLPPIAAAANQVQRPQHRNAQTARSRSRPRRSSPTKPKTPRVSSRTIGNDAESARPIRSVRKQQPATRDTSRAVATPGDSSSESEVETKQLPSTNSLAAEATHTTKPKPPTTTRREDTRRPKPIDADDERKKDDVVSFLVSRLGALLRAEDDFEIRYGAAVKIQCLARGVAARALADKRRLARQQAIAFRELRENKAAAALIVFFRSLVEQRKAQQRAEAEARLVEKQRHKAAVRIQSIARRWLAKQLVKRLKLYYKHYTKALRTLQCWFRQCLATSRVTKMRVVQRQVLCEKLEMERVNTAAANIQRTFRAFAASTSTAARKTSLRQARERDRESNRTHAAKVVQATWRGFLGRQRVEGFRQERCSLEAQRQRAQLRLHSSILLQAWYRGERARNACTDVVAVVARRRQQQADAKKQSAARRIQCWARKAFAARRTAKLRALREANATACRAGFAGLVIMRFVLCQVSSAKARNRLNVDESVDESVPAADAPSTTTINALAEQPTTPVKDPVATSPSPTVDQSVVSQLSEAASCTDASTNHVQSPTEDLPRRAETTHDSTEDDTRDQIDPNVAILPAIAAPATLPLDAVSQAPAQSQPAPDYPHIATPVVSADTVPSPDQGTEQRPARQSTPVRLSLSIRYLEERRKEELRVRQERRLAELEERSKPASRPPARSLEREHAGARRLQAFFRGILDRAMFRQKRSLIADYLADLEVMHRHAPQRPSAPKVHSRPTRRSSFTLLEEMTDRLRPHVERQRLTAAVTLVQACLRTAASRARRATKPAVAGRVHQAAVRIQCFARCAFSRSDAHTRVALCTQQGTNRVARELQLSVQCERLASWLSAAALATQSRRVACERQHDAVQNAARRIRQFALVASAKHQKAQRLCLVQHARQSAMRAEEEGRAEEERAAAVRVIQRAVRRMLAVMAAAARQRAVLGAVDARIASEAEHAAATTIQCLSRRRAAQKEVDQRKAMRQSEWDRREELATQEHLAAERSGSITTRESSARVIQRGFRVFTAKGEAQRRREAAAKAWEDRRRAAADEEQTHPTVFDSP